MRFKQFGWLLAASALFSIGSHSPAIADSRDPVKAEDLKEWLTYLASDQLEGRNTFSEGLGIAAQYIAERLKSWGVKPGGDNGSYFQRVPVIGVKMEDKSTVTVETNGQTRTFKGGEGMSLGRNLGVKRTFSLDKVEFVGYGVSFPMGKYDDYTGINVAGKAVVWIGTRAPETLGTAGGRLMGNRARTATEERGAAAGIGPGFGGGRRGGGGGAAQTPVRGALETPDFTTAERIDIPRVPVVSAQDEFLEFLFSGQDVKYADLKAKATERGPLPHFTLKNVKITFNIDPNYRIVRTQLTRNVVGIVEGKDKTLKDTFVAFGAHYDHVGYAEGEVVTNEFGRRRQDARGRVTPSAVDHREWNGADDDGSGTVSLLGLAKAFAKGSRPARSCIFVWHAGEEKGLWGSHFFSDSPTVPLEKIVAQLNIDMIGRNRDNKAEETDKVYLVGADRISTELHNVSEDANKSSAKPLKLSYEMNDPLDPEGIYYRSDHYSYASKGIPIIFYTTGLHPDYHANTDTSEKILYDKMARIVNLVHKTGLMVGNMKAAPVRDNKGARTGKDSVGKLAPEKS